VRLTGTSNSAFPAGVTASGVDDPRAFGMVTGADHGGAATAVAGTTARAAAVITTRRRRRWDMPPKRRTTIDSFIGIG
jgi:hypothetical protein